MGRSTSNTLHSAFAWTLRWKWVVFKKEIKFDLQAWVFLILALWIHNSAAWADSQIPATNICQIDDVAEQYKSRFVTITAYVSATEDGIFLHDDRCSNGIINVKFSPPYSAGSKVDDWEDEFNPYHAPREGTSGKYLYCICTGKIEYTSAPAAQVPVLIISKVEKFWYADRKQAIP